MYLYYKITTEPLPHDTLLFNRRRQLELKPDATMRLYLLAHQVGAVTLFLQPLRDHRNIMWSTVIRCGPQNIVLKEEN